MSGQQKERTISLQDGKATCLPVAVVSCPSIVVEIPTAAMPDDAELHISLECSTDGFVTSRSLGSGIFGVMDLFGKRLDVIPIESSVWLFHEFQGSPAEKKRLVIPGPSEYPEHPQWIERDGTLVHFVGTQKEYDSNYRLQVVPIDGEVRITVDPVKNAPPELTLTVKEK